MIACCAQGSESSPPKPRKGVRVSRRTAGSPCGGGFPPARAQKTSTPPPVGARVGSSPRGWDTTAHAPCPPGRRESHWGRLVRIGASYYPAPMRRFLPQCTVAYPNAGPRFLPQCGPAFAQDLAGLVEAPDGPLSRKEEWLGQGLGLFCKRNRALKGKSRPLGWRGGGFASEAEFSKGYRHFASVITLAKCGIAVKVELLCGQLCGVTHAERGIAVKTERRRRVCWTQSVGTADDPRR